MIITSRHACTFKQVNRQVNAHQYEVNNRYTCTVIISGE